MPDSSHEEHQIEVAGLPIQLRRGGSGSTLLVVHHETGNPGWMPFHDALAQSHDVLLPTLPGWDGTQRGEWMRNPRDLASVLQLLLDELAVERCAIVGLGFGGFLAAEMAVANQARIDGLVLVGAMGLQVERLRTRRFATSSWRATRTTCRVASTTWRTSTRCSARRRAPNSSSRGTRTVR